MPDTKKTSERIGNYLSRFHRATERRRFERRRCNFLARAFFTANGFHGITEYIVTAQDISEGGIRLQTDSAADIPRHFYLYVGQYQLGIGCAVVWRGEGQLRCEFIKDEQTRFVEFLAEVSDPGSTLVEIHHPLFGFAPAH